MDSDFHDHGDNFHDLTPHDACHLPDFHNPLHTDPFHHDPFSHDPFHTEPLHVDPLHPSDHQFPHETHHPSHGDTHIPHESPHAIPPDPKKVLKDLLKAGEEIEEIEGVEATARSSTAKPKKAAPHSSASGISSAENAAAKSEGAFARFMKNEKWLGKKGLALAGVAVAIGAVVYGANKLFGKKPTEIDVKGNDPKIDNASATASVNNILESFGKPKLNGSVEENIARMNADPEGYKKEVDERIAANEAAQGGSRAAERFIKGGRRNLSDIVADSRKGGDRVLS